MTSETSKPTVSRPGLVDLQVNGYGGVDFNDTALRREDVERVARMLRAEGVVGFLPTLITNDLATIESLATTILSATDASEILGLHIEGPFISPQPGARGAHPAEFVAAPNIDWVRRIHNITGGRIRLLTFAPEWENSPQFVEAVCELGIRVAIGHTLASHSQIADAVAAGATLSTHLGNGIPAQLARHPNPIWSQLSEEKLWASLIGDGFHLPREVFQTILGVKKEKAFLVSDSTRFAGMKPGRYTALIGGEVVLTSTGKLHLANDAELLAGSAMSLRQIVESLAARGWLTLDEAWELGSLRPWQFLGEPRPLPPIVTV